MIRIRGIIWGGTRTHDFEAMTRFCREVLALPQREDTGVAAYYDLPNGDRFEVMAGGDGSPEDPITVMVGFLVDDVAACRVELESKGVVFVGPIYRNDAGDTWTNFRAPDGNLYSLTCFGEHTCIASGPTESTPN